MSDYRNLESSLREHLDLARRPVAISFPSAPPEAVAKFMGSQPSGCSFWRLAANGQSFYTVATDHYNCPIGSYTHNVPLPQEREPELMQTLTLMSDIGYIRMEEIPSVFRLPEAPKAVAYAPLGDTALEPDVVLLSGKAGKLMLLVEAAHRAGVMSSLPLLPRPTCMAIPAAMASGVVISSGCIGNRTYTDIGEDEVYVVVPGKAIHKVVDELQTIVSANAKLAEYHQQRRAALATQ